MSGISRPAQRLDIDGRLLGPGHSLPSDKHLPSAYCMPCLVGSVGMCTRGIREVGGGKWQPNLKEGTQMKLPAPSTVDAQSMFLAMNHQSGHAAYSFIHSFIHLQTLTRHCVSSGWETRPCPHGTCLPVSYGGSVLTSDEGGRAWRAGLSAKACWSAYGPSRYLNLGTHPSMHVRIFLHLFKANG